MVFLIKNTMENNMENEFAWWRIENGILYFDYKQNVVIRLKDAIKIVADRLKLQQGKPFPILCNIKGIRNLDKTARWYLAREGSNLATAVALISANPLSRLLANIYLISTSPSVPTKVVADELEGIEFLLGVGRYIPE